MMKRLFERDDVDKEHVIEIKGGEAKLYFLKEDSKIDALKRVESLLLDSYESRLAEA